MMETDIRTTPATLASRKRALELGATFIENDLARQRGEARHRDELAADPSGPVAVRQGYGSTEHDVMKAMEWASAATWLRAMAALEGRDAGH